MHSQI